MKERIRLSPTCHFGRVILFFAAFAGGFAAAQIPPAGYAFAPSAEESTLYSLIRNHGDQRRVQVVLDPRLCAAARKHAEDMQQRGFFGHVNPGDPSGVNANQRVINEGYPLPANYTGSSNFVESLAGGNTPAGAVAVWRGSQGHANHVFGQIDFYRQQVVIGVGHAPAFRLGYATYVFISAPPPVGQNWSLPAGAGVSPRLEIASSGGIAFFAARPESILEVWKADAAMSRWTLDRTVVVPASGRFSGGMREGGRGFFRFGYFRQ